jgi:hypothetical protein
MGDKRKKGEAVFFISPAGMLLLTESVRNPNNRALNCIINEAFAAREMLKMTPQGNGVIGVSMNTDPKWLERYGESREATDEALRKAGKSPEMGKWVDAD